MATSMSTRTGPRRPRAAIRLSATGDRRLIEFVTIRVVTHDPRRWLRTVRCRPPRGEDAVADAGVDLAAIAEDADAGDAGCDPPPHARRVVGALNGQRAGSLHGDQVRAVRHLRP